MKRTLLLLLLALAAAPARAKLGYDADDPIRTVDVPGEYKYLARLRGPDGAEVSARRYGSTFIEGFDAPMDVWKLACGSNSVDVYVYGYGPTNSLAAPEGFTLLPEDAPGLVEPPRNTSFSIDPDGGGAIAIFDDDTPTPGARRTRRRSEPKKPAAPPPAPGEWPGLRNEFALAAWSESVRTNANLFTSARFRDEQLLPLLRREALEPLLSGPDRDAEWIDEAKDYVEHELWLCWFDSMLRRPNPDWGRAYDFTVKMGSKDPFLSWMSVYGQHKWHWDDGARKQLAGLEEAAAAGTPFQRLLAAHARNVLDPSEEHAAALRAAAVAWAESRAAHPEDSRAVRKFLLVFFGDGDKDLASALEASGADPWLGLVFRGKAEIDAAWESRGGGWAYTVTDDGWKGFAEHQKKAAEALERAHALHPEFPNAAAYMVKVSGAGCDGNLDLWFRRALAAQIDSAYAWSEYRWHNLPRWGGSVERIRRLSKAALDTRRHDTAVPVEWALGMAMVRSETGAGEKAFWTDPERAAQAEEALAPMLSSSGADGRAQALASEFLAGVRFLRGDLDGALEANNARRTWNWSNLDDAFDDYTAINTVLDGLSGPNGDRIAALYRKSLDGDWAACAAEAEPLWDSIEGIGPNEAGILSSIAFDAWLHVGYEAGEPRFFGMLRKRQLCDWLNYNSGFTLEEGTDNGSGHSKDEDGQWLKLQYAVPAELEVSGAFEPWGKPDAPHVFSVQLGGFAESRWVPPARVVAFVRERERIGAAVIDEGSDWYAANPVEPTVWRRLPEGWPARWRVVFSAGCVQAFFGDETEPALKAPIPEEGSSDVPDPAGLWFGHRNARFLGVTLRKPSAEDAARARGLAAEFAAAEAERRAAEEAEGASKHRESEADLDSFPGFDREELVEFLESFMEADEAHNAGDGEKAAKIFAELVGKLGGNDRHSLSVRTLNSLAWELHLLGRDAEALPYARRAAAAAGENAYGIAVRDTLGAVLAAAGEKDEARKVLEDALALADRIFTVSKTERKEFRNSRDYLRFHLAQCLCSAGDGAGALALVNALRGEGFVPEDESERAAYEFLAERLGADPLAPPPPPEPVVRVRVSSRADLEALLNGVAAAAGNPMLGVQAGMTIQEAIDDTEFPAFDPSRPVVGWFLAGDDADFIAAVPGDEIAEEYLRDFLFDGEGARISRGENGIVVDGRDPAGNAYFHHDGLNVFLSDPGLYATSTSLLSNAAAPRFPFAAVELDLRPGVDDPDLPFFADNDLGFDPAALGTVRVGVGFDEADGLLVGFSVAPTNPVPDAPPLDPAAILYREGADLNFAGSDWSRVFPWLPELVERINERDEDLLPGWRDVAGELGEDAVRRDREMDAVIVDWVRVLADCGADSGYLAAAPTGNAVVYRGRTDLRTVENVARYRKFMERSLALDGAVPVEDETGWHADVDHPGILHPDNADWKHLYGNRFHAEARLVPGTVATYDETAAAPGTEVPPPAGAPDFGPFSKRFGGLVPAAHIEFDLAAWAPRVAAPRKLPDGLPAHARATLDLASRGGEVLGLLRLDPACLRLLHDLSPLRTPDGEDAEFDD